MSAPEISLDELDSHYDEQGKLSPEIAAAIKGQYFQKSIPDAETMPFLIAVGIHEFLSRELPPREEILSPWLTTQSLSMIYAWRGVGKTHAALGIAYAVASGGKFLERWEAKKPCEVLYVDGEMSAAALQERLSAIVASSPKEPATGMLRIVTPDLQSGAMPDLATLEGQAEVNAVIGTAELIILDNLSCLARRGGRENDAESWLSVAEWVLTLRQQGKSVLFIHHAAKGGQQRGTSKREDLLDTVICLKRPPDYQPRDGAVFEVHYDKARGLAGDAVEPFEAKLTTDHHGAQSWATRSLTESTLDRVVELANEGLTKSEIATELDIHKSNISRAWRKAEELGLIVLKGGRKAKRSDADD